MVRLALPQTPQEVIGFIGHNFASHRTHSDTGALLPLEDQHFSVSVHDLLSAFSLLEQTFEEQDRSLEWIALDGALRGTGVDAEDFARSAGLIIVEDADAATTTGRSCWWGVRASEATPQQAREDYERAGGTVSMLYAPVNVPDDEPMAAQDAGRKKDQ